MTLLTRAPIGTRVSTGHKCPESGVWRVDNPYDSTTAPIAKGNILPPYKGRAVVWILERYA